MHLKKKKVYAHNALQPKLIVVEVAEPIFEAMIHW